MYSVESAIGLVLGTGNLGDHLTENNSAKNLYLSRDGGLNWHSIKKGVFIYDIGDHGALIVIGKKRTPTNKIEYSWDEGKTWESLIISDSSIMIENIILEPNSISQQFMIYGEYSRESILDDFIDTETTKPMETNSKSFLTYVDFASLHEPQCKGADEPGTPSSDFEYWTPYDGRHGKDKCFLG